MAFLIVHFALYSIITSLVVIPVTCILTWLFTSLRYHYAVSLNQNGRSSTKSAVPPPIVPYTLPWMGLASSLFINNKVGQFWRWIQLKQVAANLSAVTVLFGGRSTHILSRQEDVLSLISSKAVTRGHFNITVLENGLGLPKGADSKIFRVGAGGQPDEIPEYFKLDRESAQKNLLSTKAVNSLTMKFAETLQSRLNTLEGIDDWKEVDFFAWFRPIMASASLTALFGQRIEDFVPDFEKSYWAFDDGFTTLSFGVHRWLAPRAHAARERILAGLENWIITGRKLHEKDAIDEEGSDWHPYWGAKHVRDRHAIGARFGATPRALAALDLGLLFGLNTNAVPTMGWLLMHVLSPSGEALNFLSCIKDEVNDAIRKPEGGHSLDIPHLMRSPFLNAAFHEVLRVYVDLIVFRTPLVNTALSGHSMRKGDLIVAPPYMCHRDPYWATRHLEDANKSVREKSSQQDAFDVNGFHPERWIRYDEGSEKPKFSSGGTQGRFLAFGGGHHICPGRIFAKQEVLVALATVLAGLDIQVIGFTRRRSDGKLGFPALKNHIPGSNTSRMDGDLRVRIRRRVKWHVEGVRGQLETQKLA